MWGVFFLFNVLQAAPTHKILSKKEEARINSFKQAYIILLDIYFKSQKNFPFLQAGMYHSTWSVPNPKNFFR